MGTFGVKRTDKPYSRQPIDLTLEQTINADAANKLTGVSHTTNSISARQRWCKSHTLRSTIISHTMEQAGLRKGQTVQENIESFLLNVEKLGNGLRENFIRQCAEDDKRFEKLIKKIKCLILQITCKRKELELRMQRDLFGQFYTNKAALLKVLEQQIEPHTPEQQT
nr:unnamed protein product [Callosobruchus chinensis]